MNSPQVSTTRHLILIATGILGLLAAVLVLVIRYYEIKKAKAESERAQAEAELRQREMQPQASSQPANARPPSVQIDPKPLQPPPVEHPKVRDDLSVLQGTWHTVYRRAPVGKDLSKDDPRHNQELEIKGSNFRLTVRSPPPGWKPCEGSFSLDPNRVPKQFDFEGRGPLGYEIEWHGIYELSISKFRLSFFQSPKGKPYKRPTEFEGELGGDYFVFERSLTPK